MKRLFLVALILVVLLVVPVCAWTELASFTTAQGGMINGVITDLEVANPAVVWGNTTKVEFVGNFYVTDWGTCPLERSTSGYIKNASGVQVGTFSSHYYGIDSYNVVESGNIDIEYIWTGTRPPQTAKETWTFEPGTWLAFDGNTLSCIFGQYQGDPYTNSSLSIAPAMGGSALNGTYTIYSGGEVVAPVAGFSCTPTSQFPDESVVCTDTSTGSPTDWYWSIDAEAMGIDGWLTGTSQNLTWSSHYPGLYSVNLYVNNSAGNDWENKSNYVSISENATPNNCNIPVVPGLIRSWAQCVDSQTSGAVAGCDLSLYDLEGGAWSNITDRFDGTWCIDTYPGHHINAYGWADGYTPSPTSRLNLNANEHVVYELLMHPGYVPPASEGKVWVYGIVNDADTGAAIEGAVVRLDASGQTSKSDTTDAAGSMHIQWANKTQTTATASKPGYGTISKVFTTSDYGPDTVRIEIHRSIVTPTPTATTGPGGTVPTTVNPDGPVNGVYPADYTSTQGQAIMNLLAYHGYDLVLLCIFVTMLALLGFKLGK